MHNPVCKTSAATELKVSQTISQGVNMISTISVKSLSLPILDFGCSNFLCTFSCFQFFFFAFIICAIVWSRLCLCQQRPWVYL